MNKKSLTDLLLSATPTVAVMVMTLLICRGKAAIAVGITSAASSGCAITVLNRRRDTKLSILKEKFARINNAEEIIAKLPSLETKIQTLTSERESLEKTINQKENQLENVRDKSNLAKGELSQLQGKLTEVKQEISSLSETKAELERRVILINQQNPDLATRERLHSETEQLRLQKSGLEGQINTLRSQQTSLEEVQVELATKQPQLAYLQQQLEILQSQVEELEQKVIELELLRVTYDALFAERQSFETRINQLRPEIEGLELQKQQILQAIQASEAEYRQVEQQREETHRLSLEIRQKQAEISRLERDNRKIVGIIDCSEEENARLKEEKAKLEQHIKQLKGEIEELENSAKVALKALHEPLWSKQNISQTKRTIDNSATGEQQFISEFTNYLIQEGLTFPERVINAFHTSLKVQDISALVILAGISGTGKSELPQRYAEYIGAQKLTLAVQPRWDSPQDLQGFYNYIEKKYKPTDLMRGLYQYQYHPDGNKRENDDPMKDRLVIVLLDEMNLARVEYYFSDFLSKLESRRSQATYLDLDVGSLPLREEERKLPIPKQFLFVGTMNEDETTQSLSDKVLDRANVLTFGKPQQLKLREEASGNGASAESFQGYVSYSQFEGWMRKPEPNSELVSQIRHYLDNANAIMDKLGHPFAHRVYQAITRYVVNYPGVVEPNSEAFKAALADQFGQKLLPKLRGLMIDECSEQLNAFSTIINQIGDRALINAFETARQGHFGQFQWRGFVYLEQSQ
jgi:predicted  nucleic acid-binding Zn-ribbon protein